MPTITRLVPQKANPRRFNIYLDSQFAFSADEDTVVEYRLVPQKVLTWAEVEKIVLAAEAGRWIERIYRLFAKRARSEREIRDYFREKNYQAKLKGQEGISDLIQNLAVQKLKEKGLIDDRTFAKAWIESRKKNRGRRRLSYELRQKGISPELIAEMLGEASAADDLANAESLLVKKLKTWHNLPVREIKKKAFEFLLRKGFDYGVVQQIVEKIRKKS